ncbi:MAG TPA: hypothetical protein DCP02_02195 [Actinobacteria bacterium]|nr:hypothetical protein [Actinomycetota bacterium]
MQIKSFSIFSGPETFLKELEKDPGSLKIPLISKNTGNIFKLVPYRTSITGGPAINIYKEGV